MFQANAILPDLILLILSDEGQHYEVPHYVISLSIVIRLSWIQMPFSYLDIKMLQPLLRLFGLDCSERSFSIKLKGFGGSSLCLFLAPPSFIAGTSENLEILQ
jgi:hypothetical protein